MHSEEGTFGEVLRGLRLRARFGLRRFALMVDLEPSNLSAMEAGRRRAPADPEKLREIAEALGLVEDSGDWRRFFDAAARPNELPADVRHMAGRRLVPVLLRAIDNRKLDDRELERLIESLNSGQEGSDGSKGPDVQGGRTGEAGA